MKIYPEHLESICIDIMQEFYVNWKSKNVEKEKSHIRIEFFEKLLPRNIFWYWKNHEYKYTKFGDMLEKLFEFMWTYFTEDRDTAIAKYKGFSWNDVRFLNEKLYHPYDRSFSI